MCENFINKIIIGVIGTVQKSLEKIIEAIGIWRTMETIQAAAFLKYWGERQNIDWKTQWVNNIKTGYGKSETTEVTVLTKPKMIGTFNRKER